MAQNPSHLYLQRGFHGRGQRLPVPGQDPREGSVEAVFQEKVGAAQVTQAHAVLQDRRP